MCQTTFCIKVINILIDFRIIEQSSNIWEACVVPQILKAIEKGKERLKETKMSTTIKSIHHRPITTIWALKLKQHMGFTHNHCPPRCNYKSTSKK